MSDDPKEYSTIKEMKEQAEREYERLWRFSWPGSYHTLRGREWSLNTHGDRLIMSDLGTPHAALERDNRAYTSDIFLLCTTRAGHETGRASATLYTERDEDGVIERVRTRIHELEVHPPFRGAGLGDALLQQIELQARRFGSDEVYDVFSPQGDTERVREFCKRNKFDFRVTPDGEQVFKTLIAPDAVGQHDRAKT